MFRSASEQVLQEALFDSCACLIRRFAKQFSLFELLSIQDILSVNEEGSTDQKAFLSAYAKALVPAMLMDNRQDEIRETAALLGLFPFKCDTKT
jgi:hypothetical protein